MAGHSTRHGQYEALRDRLFAAAGLEHPGARLAGVLLIGGIVAGLRAESVGRRDRLLAALQLGFVAALRMRMAALVARMRWGDEATAALDDASERRLFDGLRRLDPRPTILLVAHRQINLDRCDRIVHLRGGRIIAD